MEETHQDRHWGLSNGTKPIFTVLHHPYCTFLNLILYLYRQNKTFQSAKLDFTAWKRKSDCSISILLWIGFPLRRHLRPSDVNLCSDGSGKINSADTFKVYGKKGGIPQGRQMGVFIVQMWQLMIDCALTHRVKTYSNRWAEKSVEAPCLTAFLIGSSHDLGPFSVFIVLEEKG